VKKRQKDPTYTSPTVFIASLTHLQDKMIYETGMTKAEVKKSAEESNWSLVDKQRSSGENVSLIKQTSQKVCFI